MNTGHVKQVAAFGKLVGFCNAHGAMYNPSKAGLSLTALNSLLTSAQQQLESVKTTRTAWDNAVNQREAAFRELPKFMTRMINTLASNGASKETVKEAYFFRKKFEAKVLNRAAIPSEQATGASPARTRSTSQHDFDSKADNFAALVKVMEAEPTYAPNETDLQIGALQAKAGQMRWFNQQVVQTYVDWNNTRVARNKMLYGANGIYGTASLAKKYVKGVFGYQSVAYNQIKGIRFIDPIKPV